ncbi:MAG: PhoH family protein [Pseudomonadales bacterium]|nr:PhoH family protein [Pseudomonadales bacterium]
MASLCGPLNAHLQQIETRLGVRIKNRGNSFQISGENEGVSAASKVLLYLYKEVKRDAELTANAVHLSLQESGVDLLMTQATEAAPLLIVTKKKSIKPRGENQLKYCAAIKAHDINFGIGPAGTGKTYLAVASAVEALEQERARRILLVRPAVEAGEKLGFLPGDLSQKIDPYLRPLYDALYEMLGFEKVEKLLEKNIIEVAPLAYMRGRTLNDSFIILDESQNTTVEQMKMFLTRVGFGSTVVVTGDITQVDLPFKVKSGLRHVLNVLGDVDGISFTNFSSKDVVRHPLVQRIVEAYEQHEKNAESGN